MLRKATKKVHIPCSMLTVIVMRSSKRLFPPPVQSAAPSNQIVKLAFKAVKFKG